MEGLITPAMYCSEAHFTSELATLFRNCWSFVGLRFELTDNMHRGITVADTEVIIQLDKIGQPHAYLNVCTHRHSRLCRHGVHKNPMRCPYHDWIFNREGVPTGIPQPEAFPSVTADPEKYRLRAFSCETAGEFIFVRLSETGPTLRDYLGDQFDFLEQISESMFGVIDEFHKDVAANWKVAIENALEGYHVPAVHDATLMQIHGMEKTAGAPKDFIADSPHSYMNHPADPTWIAHFKKMEHKTGQWKTRNEHYTHHLIFPNLTITSFMGYSFHVQRFEPVKVDCTRVHSRIVNVKFEGQNETGRKIIEQIWQQSRDFTYRVFDEDASVCAEIQAGLKSADRVAVIGDGVEERVKHFHRSYISQMS